MKAIWSWFRAREWDEPSLGKPAASPHGPDWTGPAIMSLAGATAVIRSLPKLQNNHSNTRGLIGEKACRVRDFLADKVYSILTS